MNITDILPPTKERKKPKAPYRKPASIKLLESDYKRFYYSDKSIPENLQSSFKFRDDTANGLTKCITSYLTMNGCFAARINTTGVYDQRLGAYRRSGATNGMADITSVINGKHISIEVKSGKDKARTEQLKVQKQIEEAGGEYWFVHSFDEFLNKISTIKQ